MTPAALDRRLAEIEAELDRALAKAEVHVKPAHLMTDAEAVEEWRRLCKLPIPPPPEPNDESARRSSRSGGS